MGCRGRGILAAMVRDQKWHLSDDAKCACVRDNTGRQPLNLAEGKNMVSDVIGIRGKRALILLAATVAMLFAATSLTPGEPAAQSAAPNGKIVYSGYDTELEQQDRRLPLSPTGQR